MKEKQCEHCAKIRAEIKAVAEAWRNWILNPKDNPMPPGVKR